jgi:hypothetical protein
MPGRRARLLVASRATPLGLLAPVLGPRTLVVVAETSTGIPEPYALLTREEVRRLSTEGEELGAKESPPPSRDVEGLTMYFFPEVVLLRTPTGVFLAVESSDALLRHLRVSSERLLDVLDAGGQLPSPPDRTNTVICIAQVSGTFCGHSNTVESFVPPPICTNPELQPHALVV